MTPISAKPAEAKVMVSNLPLLFARGSPTSLESMCLEELQVFLRFVLKCEQNLTSVDLNSLDQPQWWPPDLDWSENILQRKEQRGKMSITLRSAIRACYTYHDCMYLLEFCRKLITFTGGIENLQVVDNRDGTRSLLNRISKKLLVTFRAENQDYDKLHFEHQNSSKTTNGLAQPGSSKKPVDSKLKQQLVSSKSDNTSDPSLTKCVDVYLCDTCDKDFDSLTQLLNHEKTCGKTVTVPTILAKSAQDSFLGNVKLFKKGQPMPTPRKIKESERPRAANYEKFMEIDVASPLGRYIVSSSGLGINQLNPASRGYKSIEEYNEELDSKCPGTMKSLKNSNANMDIRGKWNITYKCSKKKANLWTHTYCFTAAEIEAKVRVMKAGLTPKSLRIYRKCNRKKVGLTLKKLEKETMASIYARYAEMERLDKLDQLKAETEFKMRNKINGSPIKVPLQEPVDDKVIDELLEDDGSDNENEVKQLPNMNYNDNGHPSSLNSFMNFKNIGFRTSTDNIESFTHQNTPFVSSSFIVQDEAYSSNDHETLVRKPQLKISVPRPLPELQRIGYLKSLQKIAVTKPEVECVDLCSSDDE